MKPAREQPGVQRDMVRLRETKGEMLCLYAPGSPTRRSYRAVLEVSPITCRSKLRTNRKPSSNALERSSVAVLSRADPRAQPAAGFDALHPALACATESKWATPIHMVCAGSQSGRTLAKNRCPAYAHRTACLCHYPGLTGHWQFQEAQRVPDAVRQAPGAAHGRDRGTGAAGTGTACRGTHPATGVLRPHLPSPAQRRAGTALLQLPDTRTCPCPSPLRSTLVCGGTPYPRETP